MTVELTKTFRFEAAHWLPTFPDGHKCRRLHGHSFRVDVVVRGEVPTDQGYLIDYGEISAAMAPLLGLLDHHLLNEVEGLSNPVAEQLAAWVWARLKPVLACLYEVRVHETCTSSCTYRGE